MGCIQVTVEKKPGGSVKYIWINVVSKELIECAVLLIVCQCDISDVFFSFLFLLLFSLVIVYMYNTMYKWNIPPKKDVHHDCINVT